MCGSCTFLVVSGAWGGQGVLSQTTGRSLAFTLRCSCPFHSQKENQYVGRWAAFKGCGFQLYWCLPRSFLSSLHSQQVSPSDTSGHFTHRCSGCEGWRASRAVLALSHWEYCHLNSSAFFGGEKMGISDRRPALYQFALPCPLQSWKTARSNFVFLQIHLQEESMAATWLWLMSVFENVVMNKTLKVMFSSDWMFCFILYLCFCKLWSRSVG